MGRTRKEVIITLVVFCLRLGSDDRGPEVGTVSVLEGWVTDIPVWVWSLYSEAGEELLGWGLSGRINCWLGQRQRWQ